MNKLGIRQGKAWGYTTMIFENLNVEVHVIEIEKGGYCSIHAHDKINIFYVVSGKLKVKTWVENKLTDISEVNAGQMTAVYTDFEHQFEALEKTICIEVYHIFLKPGDIRRRKGSVGGIKK